MSSSADDEVNVANVSETIRNAIRRQLVEELLIACHGDERKRDLILELSTEVLGERISLPTDGGQSAVTDDSSMSSSKHSDESSDNNKKIRRASIDSIEMFEKSPYELEGSVEDGEELFETFEKLMVPLPENEGIVAVRHSRREFIQPSEEAIEVFGKDLAQILLTARRCISDSGVLYNPEWLTARIRGIEIKDMNNLVILVCLKEHRISKVDRSIMTRLVADLRVGDIVRQVMEDLIEKRTRRKQFPKLSICSETPLPYYRSNRTECQKCELFIARAYGCRKYLKRDTMGDETMVNKIFHCLRMIEGNLDVIIPSPSSSPVPDDQPVLVASRSSRRNSNGSRSDHPTTTTSSSTTANMKINGNGGNMSPAIEQLDLATGAVIKTWESVEHAVEAMGPDFQTSTIRKNMAGFYGSAYGYFWRLAGSTTLPSKTSGKIEMPVEQLDLETGRLIKRWKSVHEVVDAAKGDMTLRTIQKNLTGKTHHAYGYFWRYTGSSILPLRVIKREPSAIEQLDKDTGFVIRQWQSAAHAAKGLGEGVRPSTIRKNLCGAYPSAYGYFWRNVGSTKLPPQPLDGPPEAIEQLDLDTGAVIREWKSPLEAAETLGRGMQHRTIKKNVSGRTNSAYGYFWRYVGSTGIPSRLANKEGTESERNETVAIEQLDLETGEVIKEWATVQDAAEGLGNGKLGFTIRRNLTGVRTSAFGYFWRYVGSTAVPSRPVEKDPLPIEQLDVDTGVVIREFQSVQDAIDTMDRGWQLRTIQRNLEGSCNSAYGYFWRYTGSTLVPFKPGSQDGLESDQRETVAIEQLDMETGEVIKEWSSIQQAVEGCGQGMQSYTIRKNLKGLSGSAYGYFWRYVGSTVLPTKPEEKEAVPIEQLELATGKVIREWKSVHEAVSTLKGQVMACTIQKTLDSLNNTAHGYFWRYAGSTRVPIRPVEQNIAVEQLDLDTGLVIRKWDSLQEACDTLVGRNMVASTIQKQLVGTYRSAYGYFWRLAGSTNVPERRSTPGGIEVEARESAAVEQLDLETGAVIKQWGSIQEAVESLGNGLQAYAIRRNLAGAYHSAYGYYWRYLGSTKMPGSPLTVSPPKPKRRGGSRSRDSARDSTGGLNDSSSSGTKGLERESSGDNAEILANAQALDASGNDTDDDGNSDASYDARPSRSRKRKTKGRSKRGSGNDIDGDGNSDLSHITKPSHSRKRKIEGRSEREVQPPKKMKPDEAIDTAALEDDMSDTAPTGVSFSKFAGRPSTRIIGTMTDIHESPYQENSTAEIGEAIFDKFKELLQPESSARRRQPQATAEAVEVFGGTSVANSIVEASTRIAMSGMTYSTEWREGKVQGQSVGTIPQSVLLLLLQEQRFSRPSVEEALNRIVVDFDLCKTMISALVRWKLASKYPKLVTINNHTAFITHRPQSYKCLIFVARVLNCIKILKMERLPASLRGKVECCFEILARNVGSGGRNHSNQVVETSETVIAEVDKETSEAVIADDEEEDSIVSTLNSTGRIPQKITETSHVLFRAHQQSVDQDKAHTAEGENGNSPDDVVVAASRPSKPKRARKMTKTKPAADYDVTSWIPNDPADESLFPLECEVAWLVEEACHCLRDRRTVHWRFLYKYASPALKVELRRIKDDGDQSLEQLVRLDDAIVYGRFKRLRQLILRKLLRGQYRPKMEQAIPLERTAASQAQEKKSAVASSTDTTTLPPEAASSPDARSSPNAGPLPDASSSPHIEL